MYCALDMNAFMMATRFRLTSNQLYFTTISPSVAAFLQVFNTLINDLTLLVICLPQGNQFNAY